MARLFARCALAAALAALLCSVVFVGWYIGRLLLMGGPVDWTAEVFARSNRCWLPLAEPHRRMILYLLAAYQHAAFSPRSKHNLPRSATTPAPKPSPPEADSERSIWLASATRPRRSRPASARPWPRSSSRRRNSTAPGRLGSGRGRRTNPDRHPHAPRRRQLAAPHGRPAGPEPEPHRRHRTAAAFLGRTAPGTAGALVPRCGPPRRRRRRLRQALAESLKDGEGHNITFRVLLPAGPTAAPSNGTCRWTC